MTHSTYAQRGRYEAGALLRRLLAVISLAVLAGAPYAAQAIECDTSICQGDPCTITGTHELEPGCDLDFGNKDVTVGPNGALVWTGSDEEEGSVSARNLTVHGSMGGTGMTLNIDTTGNFSTARPGEGKLYIRDKASSYGGGGYVYHTTGFINIDAGGDVTLGGSLVSLKGAIAYLTVFAGGNIRIDSVIKTETCGEDIAQIYLQTDFGSITATKRLSARSCGPEAGGWIQMLAGGDISVTGSMEVTAGPLSGGNLAITLEAGGNATIDRTKLTSPDNGGTVEVTAGGDISLRRDIKAKARTIRDSYGYLVYGNGGDIYLTPGPTGIVRIAKRIDVSCTGVGCQGGEVSIGPACYADLTGARLFARPDGTFSLGCSCLHPSGSTTCDGGCVLDRTRFVPPLSTQLPPCS